jgi:hypothetical protein
MSVAKEVAVIIPTTFNRLSYLQKTIESISLLDLGQILIILPRDFELNGVNQFIQANFDKGDLTSRIFIMHQSGQGIANAINTGFKNISEEIVIASWIGDDDYILAPSLDIGVNFLRLNPNYVGTFGKCKYINEKDEDVWENNFGNLSFMLTKFGPNLVPQPGSFFRLSALQQVNFVSEKFSNSFDHDLYLKLMKVGKLKFFNEPFGVFRWHSDSVSVKKRGNLCFESGLVRIKNRNSLIGKFLQIFLEPFIFSIVYFAPYFVIRNKKTP